MFIHPYTWSFYTASVLVGVGAAGERTFFGVNGVDRSGVSVSWCLCSSAVDGSGERSRHQLH